MTLRHLRIFVAVAETGKMSAAAELLYISQPTVSQTIRELEQHYGTRLFERYSQKLFITESGRRLLEYARQTLRDFDRLEENMLTYDGKIPLRIGSTVSTSGILLPRLLRDFEKQMPQTETFVTIGNTSHVVQKLLHAQVDIALAQGDIQSSELIAAPVLTDELVIVSAAHHPLASLPVITPKQIEQHPFCLREAGSSTRSMFDRFVRKYRLIPKIKWEATCPDTVRRSVLQNNCLAIMPLRQVAEYAEKGSMHIITGPMPDWSCPHYLVCHRDKKMNPEIKAFRDIVLHCETPLDKEALHCSRIAEDNSSLPELY